MAKSLKSYVPRLAQLLNMTPDSLYERQRALVREGLLKPEPGRGPGSGVRATPETVALLLIAVLATDGLSDVGRRTRDIAEAIARKAYPVGPGRPSREKRAPCRVTGASRFLNALATLLADPQYTERDEIFIHVQREAKQAHILFTPGPVGSGGHHRTWFIADNAIWPQDVKGMLVDAAIRGRDIKEIAYDLAKDSSAGAEDG